MVKIVIIGAGSGFGSTLSLDILAREPMRDACIGLCDINAERLEATYQYVRFAVESHGLPATVEKSTDREEILPGADFVVTSVAVGGPAYSGPVYANEMKIPARYGIDQSVGDTVGPAGVFRVLRTGPVQLGFCRDVERLCPGALVLNYTNPMAMLTWIHSEGSGARNVGLCHSVQGTTRRMAEYAGVPYDEVSYWVAGINHQAWVLKFLHDGEDAYPLVRKALDDPEVYSKDAVRFEMMKHFGYFPTESSHHNSEYLPYFRRSDELYERFGLKRREVSEEPNYRHRWLDDSGSVNLPGEPPKLVASREYASQIIQAEVTDEPFRFNGNVMNTGLITNLPEGCCVEVPCMADGRGVHPCYVGELPPQCAAINRSNVAVQELSARAVLDRDREAAFHAVALDPLTAAVLPLHKIREMFEEMWQANAAQLTYFD